MSRTSRKRLWVGGLSAASAVAVAAGLVAAAPASERSASAAAATAPDISLVAASPEVTLQQWEDLDQQRYIDLTGLGTYVGVKGGPLELRATRADRTAPVRLQQFVHSGGKVIKKDLPAGLVKDFRGLPGFTEITFTDAGGKKVATRKETFCPNNASARIDPGAAPSPRYPEECHDGPFTVGMVWGVEKGWATNTSAGMTSTPLALPTGTYTAQISVAKKYRDLFGIANKPQNVKVNVTPPDPGNGPGGRSAAHSGHGDHGTGKGDSGPRGTAGRGGHDGHGTMTGPVGTMVERKLAEDSSYLPVVPEIPHALKQPARAALKSRGDGPGYTDGSRFAPRAKAAEKRPAGPAAVPANAPKPDLRALPAWDIAIETERAGEPKGRDYLAFASTTWNAGDSPLVVDGFRQFGKPLMDAYQYFYDAKGKQVGHAPTGTMEWDPRAGHNHWHFTDFAAYRLLTEDKKEAVRSDKEAFCLVNTDAIDYTLKNADWRPHGTELGSACGQDEPQALSIRQSLAVGSGDTYSRDLPGQSFDITDVPNGTYWIQVVANPSKRLHETTLANNNAYRKVVLGGKPGARTVTAAPIGAESAG
ncbi:lysyl oxidase family protein [Streptomyces qinzhouensis]|uniref:Protein-lysine 6-oxidase n=1 Tax=Streptomyces qinzhouensis TaxID=2599401 RepID=A0A5B8JEW3_9ACTN|nr:lysyl oxidase family protein [Streptomyces qinzhouensis]QDY80315.1 protein-lysine 6-oxidase [Streptomyces qinzhouensis]